MPGVSEGNHIGPYELLAPIGAGGMGEVWKARDTRLNRMVAVKFSQAQVNDRFEREARAIAALNHPNIAQIYDVGENYIVMEYVEGEPVRAPDNTRKLLDIAVQIADGLAAAHSAGFVHRDLKPDNILITREGRVKILDFGLARQAVPAASETTQALSITNPGTAVGTAAYMSPEQARGQEVDYRSDQFSFGLILYELASGRRAFQRNSTAETMTAIIREDPEPLPVSIPTPLRWTIERLLAKDRGQRYASTEDLVIELRSLQDRLSQTFASPSQAAPVRRPRLLVWSAAAALVGVACTAAAWALFPARPVLRPELKYTPFATDKSNERMPAWSPDGRSIAYVRDVDGLSQVFTRALDAATPDQISYDTLPAGHPFWSSDSSRVYFESGNNLYFAGATGGTQQLFVRDAIWGALSPDGRHLAFFRPSDRSLYLASGAGSDAVQYAGKGFPKQIRSAIAKFSPDSSSLAILALTHPGEEENRELWIAPVGEGDPVKSPAQFALYSIALGNPIWSPKKGHIIVSEYSKPGGEAHLYDVDLKTGAQHAITSGPLSEREPAISPDGKRIAVSMETSNSEVFEFDMHTGRGRPVADNSRRNLGPAWNPSGQEFAYVSDVTGKLAVWFRTENGPARPLVLSGPEVANIRRLAFSPDGQRLALDSYGTEHRPFVVSAAGGVPVAIDPDHNHKDTHGAAFSPDGAWIAYTYSAQHGARIAKIPSAGGQRVNLVDAGESPGYPVAWSPAGDWIAYSDDSTSLDLISPDGKSKRTLLKAGYRTWAFDRTGAHMYGIRRGANRAWEFWSVDVADGHERKLTTLDVPREKELSSLAVHPDEKRFLVAVETSSWDIWTVEGATLQ